MNTRVSLTVLLVLFAVVLVAGGVALYWMLIYQPAQIHSQATATSTASTATSQASGHTTAVANTNATATVVADATSRVTATQIALGDIYNKATTGTPALNDALNAQSKSSWDENQANSVGCAFTNGMYDAQTISGYFTHCVAKSASFGNLAFQIEMNIISGDSGGIIVRADSNFSGYYFRVSTDGTFLARRVTINGNNTTYMPLFAGKSTAVNTGNKQFNTLTVIMQGGDIYMYINQKFVFKSNDTVYKSGQVGVFADSDVSSSEIVFRNAQVWKL